MCGRTDRNDLVVVAVQDQGRNVELLEVSGEVGFREGLDAVEGAFEAGLHPLQPERIPNALRHVRARPIEAVERQTEILEELRSVGENAGPDRIEHFERQSARIGSRLQHEGRNRTDQDCLGDPLRTVASDVACDFTAAGRVPDMDGVAKVQCFNEGRQIIGVGVHFVAVPRLTRPPMPATVVSNAPVPARRQKHHLVIPRVCRERPPVAKDDGLARAPVLEVNLCAVLG